MLRVTLRPLDEISENIVRICEFCEFSRERLHVSSQRIRQKRLLFRRFYALTCHTYCDTAFHSSTCSCPALSLTASQFANPDFFTAVRISVNSAFDLCLLNTSTLMAVRVIPFGAFRSARMTLSASLLPVISLKSQRAERSQ